jgi:hypothetical protein
MTEPLESQQNTEEAIHVPGPLSMNQRHKRTSTELEIFHYLTRRGIPYHIHTHRLVSRDCSYIPCLCLVTDEIPHNIPI